MAFSAFAVTAPGLESVAEAELRALGVTPGAREPGGVAFEVTQRLLARVLINVRTVTRVLVRIAEFRATSFSQLEKRANAVEWGAWIREGSPAHFRVTCRKSRLYHSDAVAERLARALSGSVQGVTIGAPVDEDTDDDASQLFVVRFSHDVCTVSVDAAGAPLYKRGYRTAIAKAPLRETFGAAMLLSSGWNGERAIYDPFCGSGTIPIEAAMIARRIAPGLHRRFAAERWPNFAATLWEDARGHARHAIVGHATIPIVGSDRDTGAVAAAKQNAERAGVLADVTFDVSAVSAARSDAPNGLLITNPPYGVRVGDQDMRNLYSRFGRVAHRSFGGWSTAVLFTDNAAGRALERQFSVSLHEVWRSLNGGIPVRLMRGEIPPV